MAAETCLGIDVSHHQGRVDWAKVAQSCAFAFCKASEGVGWMDPDFERNYAAIREAGLVRGAYHFARVSRKGGQSVSGIVRDAEAEADWFLDVIGEDRARTLPAVLDLEWDDRAKGIPPEQIIAWALAWLERVERATESIPILYTGRNYWRFKLGQTNAFHRYHLWLAQYKANNAGTGPRYTISGWPWQFWQYTSKGEIAGVETRCDLNLFAGSPRDLEMFLGRAAYETRETLPQYHHAEQILTDRLACWAAETFSRRRA